MAIEKDYYSQGRKIIEEYLEASNLLIEQQKEDGGVYGYTALLIMLCVIDAMGQSLRPVSGTNFDLLSDPLFNINNKDKKMIVNQIKCWYRHGLSHVGAIPENIYIELGSIGDDPLLIVSSQIKSIRLKSFHNKIISLWELRKNSFCSERINLKPIGFPNECAPFLTEPSSGGSTESVVTSGCVSIRSFP
ncbi:MAG: hypothetical protein GJU72_03885 [Acidithiobacillus ferriphilus]|nr:hypothetical protein [Acidithiobacillus ferriphilus]